MFVLHKKGIRNRSIELTGCREQFCKIAVSSGGFGKSCVVKDRVRARSFNFRFFRDCFTLASELVWRGHSAPKPSIQGAHDRVEVGCGLLARGQNAPATRAELSSITPSQRIPGNS